jgi:putative membrane protein
LVAAAHRGSGEMELTEAEREAVTEAIRRAEARTSGEIFCIVDEADSYYPHVALAWAAAAALFVPYLLWLFGVDVGMLMRPGWLSGHWPDDAATIAYHRFGFAYTVLPIVFFILAYGVALVPPVSRLLTPRQVRHRHVHRIALEQFRAKGLHLTAERTGVLIFVSLSDQEAEVVADTGIYAKVPVETWADATAVLIAGIKRGQTGAGLIEAVDFIADLLAKHFPPRTKNPNELSDKVVEL